MWEFIVDYFIVPIVWLAFSHPLETDLCIVAVTAYAIWRES